jgi:hypothetical protein
LHKILGLQITKKRSLEPITIDIQNLDIKKITSITANKDESLFICNALPQEKSFMINLTSKVHPLITGYGYYYFKNDNPSRVYVALDHCLGTFDIITNVFNPIIYFPFETIRGMQLNNNQSIIVIDTINASHIGRKAKDGIIEIDYGSFNFTQIDYRHFREIHPITATTNIHSICLHPQKDLLFMTFTQNYNSYFHCMIDLNSLTPTALSLPDMTENEWIHRYETAFLNDEILHLSSGKYHHFINIATKHHWTKKKDPLILFTTDKSHCLESYSTYSNGRDHKQFKMIPLCNESILLGITSLNKGQFPLFLFDIIHHNAHTLVTLNHDEYQEYTQLKQSPLGNIIDTLYTITQKNRFSRFCGLLRHHCPTQKNIKAWTAAITFMMIGWGLYRGIDYFDNNQQLDSSDKRSLIENMFKLVCFLIRV